MQYIAVLLALTAAVSASPEWDNLRVTWSLNPLNPWAFDAVPRDLNSYLGGFELRDNQCNIANANFVGQRYWYKKDPALTLIYDVNGIIAGMQTSMNKSEYAAPAYMVGRNYQDDGDFVTVTAYFVDPNTICTGGRTADQLKNEGTGTGLWLQWGPDPIKDSVQVPYMESDAITSTWKFGHCFRTMGNHYWYNVTKDMSCDHYVPNCLMYNKGVLTAFCFAINAPLKSPRYEHPTTDILAKFIDPVPDCFYTDPNYEKLSTIHIYFKDNARLSSWC